MDEYLDLLRKKLYAYSSKNYQSAKYIIVSPKTMVNLLDVSKPHCWVREPNSNRPTQFMGHLIAVLDMGKDQDYFEVAG